MMLEQDLTLVLPELVLAVYAMGALMIGVWGAKDGATPLLTWMTAIVMAGLAAWIGIAPSGAATAFDGMLILDGFARFAKVVILLAAAAILLIGQGPMAKLGIDRFEYPILVALSALGMMVMVSAGDLIALYMGLELQSLALYVVAALHRDDARSTEAGLKYFVLGALSSGLLLYGASLTYGFAGTTRFDGIIAATEGNLPVGLLLGLAFMFAGLAFKVSAAPFHMWTPDVYEGAPTPITAFFASAPKMASMALFARLAHDAFGAAVGDWTQIVAFLSLLSMFLGAIAAIGQSDIKRLMAYSSIAHMGYALMGLAAGTADGVQAMLIYMAIYVTMNVGTFAFILTMERDGKPVTDIASLNLYARAQPLRAVAVLVLMFSMAGIPPLLGFFSKFYVLMAAVNAGMAWLAIAGVIASVIGAFYYLRIVYLMYFGEEGEPLTGGIAPAQWAALVGAAAVMVLGIGNMFGVEGLARAAAETLVR